MAVRLLIKFKEKNQREKPLKIIKTITIHPFIISVGIATEGFVPISWEFYKGKESGQLTMSFCLFNVFFIISIL